MNLGKSLRALGRKEEALAVSRTRFELLKQAPPEQRDEGIHYHVACEMAQIVPLVGRGKPEAELTTAERAERQAYADRAVEEFRLALADGFSDIPLFVRDEDLDPIRSRDDFRRLLYGRWTGSCRPTRSPIDPAHPVRALLMSFDSQNR